MPDRAQPPETHAPDAPDERTGLSSEQLAGEQAQDLPDREAMSILSVGGLSGALPIPVESPVGTDPPVDPSPPVALPDPADPAQLPPGVPPGASAGLPAGANLTDVPNNIGDISDVADVSDVADDVRTLMDPRDLADLRDVADVTGAPVDGGIPVTMVPPSDDPSTTLA